MGELRDNAPLLDSYLNYFANFVQGKELPFTIPGHKHRTASLDKGFGELVDRDLPLYGGLDEIKLTKQTLRKAEAMAAEFWGADYARFSAGGSTHANQAIVLALGQPGQKVAVSRTAHRSILSALVLAGLDPIWLSPEINQTTGIPIGIPLSQIELALAQNPIAILLTEPGYLGTLSDLPPIIQTAHKAKVPVIVDAAWGGHFGFSPALPEHVIKLGADALITSIHKALPGYSAAALLLAQGKLLDLNRVEQAFETTHTTSPAGAPLASVDATRALLAARGEELTSSLVKNVEAFRHRVSQEFDLPIFLSEADFGAKRFDGAKIVLRVNQLGASGVEIERDLITAGVKVEMADRDTIVFLATLVDTEVELNQLAEILIPILKQHQGDARASATSLSWSVKPQQVISMRVAYFAQTEMVTAQEAIGRISADLIAPYPPGVAVVAPGELLTREIVEGLVTTQAAGVRIAYASDSSLQSFRVVKQ